MIKPERPVQGAEIPSGWFGDFYDFVMSLVPSSGDGKTFFVKRTDTGWTGSTRPEGVTPGADGGGESAGGSVPAKVVSKSGLYYLCDLFADGIDSAATAENQKVFVLQLNLAETLPAGTWIMVSESAIGETGGGNVP